MNNKTKNAVYQSLAVMGGISALSVIAMLSGYSDVVPVLIVLGVASLVISPIERVDTVDRGQAAITIWPLLVTIIVSVVVGIFVFSEFGPQALIFIGILFVVGYVVNEYRNRYNKVGEVNGE